MAKLTDEEREQVAKLTAELRKVPGLAATANVLNLLVVRLEAAENGWNSSSEVVDHLSTKLCASELRCNALAAHVERLKEVAEQLELADNQSEFNQSANRLWRTVGEAPNTSLARLITEKQAEALEYLAEHCEIDKTRKAFIYRQANELRRQAEPSLCIDEGCPQHGTDHVCVNRQAEEGEP